MTNTNWQSYAGETTMSTFSQMIALTVQNFVSAATGATVAAALARAFVANRGEGVGNFWADLIRTTLYVLLPLSFVLAVVLVALGLPQTLAAGRHRPHAGRRRPEDLALRAWPSQEAIKMLGINGGGIFNANSAHPFENPTPLTNLITAVSINVLGWAAFFAFGRSVLASKDVRALVIAAAVLLLGRPPAASIWPRPSRPRPWSPPASTPSVNMEGKEIRFGAPATAAWAAMTTGASNGSVNGMHSSLMPLGGGIAMFLMHLGEILPGGIGSGIAVMVVMALLAVFVAGLMVGRTPEYLGKKIEAKEVKLSILAVLVIPVCVLGFSAIAAVLPEALKGLMQRRPARPVGDPLRLHLRHGQQRLGLRGPDRQRALVGHHPGRGHGDGPVLADRRGAGHRRLAGGQAQAGPVGRHAAHRRRPVRGPADRGDPDPGRPAVLPRTGAGPDRRALPSARRVAGH